MAMGSGGASPAVMTPPQRPGRQRGREGRRERHRPARRKSEGVGVKSATARTMRGDSRRGGWMNGSAGGIGVEEEEFLVVMTTAVMMAMVMALLVVEGKRRRRMEGMRRRVGGGGGRAQRQPLPGVGRPFAVRDGRRHRGVGGRRTAMRWKRVDGG